MSTNNTNTKRAFVSSELNLQGEKNLQRRVRWDNATEASASLSMYKHVDNKFDIYAVSELSMATYKTRNSFKLVVRNETLKNTLSFTSYDVAELQEIATYLKG